MSEEEISWAKIPHTDTFWVSNVGAVRKENKIIKQRNDGRGYLCVDIKVNGKWVTKKVHNLVMASFVSETPKGFHIDHLDHNKSNNRLSNLRFREAGDNSADCKRGSRKGAKKATEEQINAVVSLFKGFWGVSFISKAVGLSETTVRRIIKREVQNE